MDLPCAETESPYTGFSANQMATTVTHDPTYKAGSMATHDHLPTPPRMQDERFTLSASAGLHRPIFAVISDFDGFSIVMSHRFGVQGVSLVGEDL
jgi:hypothetical protein